MNSSLYGWKDIPGSSHEIILSRVHELGTGLKVLDLGAGKGELGRRIRRNCSWLVGIESDPVAAQSARTFYDELVVGDVMEVCIQSEKSFDLIVLGDILEHLAEPEKCLKRFLPYLADTGRVLISVPNVANITTRMSLLFGRFDYQPKGILDCTHLRFYTFKTARTEIERAGYAILDTKATAMPVELALPWLNGSAFQIPVRFATQFLAMLFPKMFGYQFFFEAKPKRDSGYNADKKPADE